MSIKTLNELMQALDSYTRLVDMHGADIRRTEQGSQEHLVVQSKNILKHGEIEIFSHYLHAIFESGLPRIITFAKNVLEEEKALYFGQGILFSSEQGLIAYDIIINPSIGLSSLRYQFDGFNLGTGYRGIGEDFITSSLSEAVFYVPGLIGLEYESSTLKTPFRFIQADIAEINLGYDWSIMAVIGPKEPYLDPNENNGLSATYRSGTTTVEYEGKNLTFSNKPRLPAPGDLTDLMDPMAFEQYVRELKVVTISPTYIPPINK